MKTLLLILVLMGAGCATTHTGADGGWLCNDQPKPVVIDRMTCSDGTRWVLYQGEWTFQMEGK